MCVCVRVYACVYTYIYLYIAFLAARLGPLINKKNIAVLVLKKKIAVLAARLGPLTNSSFSVTAAYTGSLLLLR